MVSIELMIETHLDGKLILNKFDTIKEIGATDCVYTIVVKHLNENPVNHFTTIKFWSF